MANNKLQTSKIISFFAAIAIYTLFSVYLYLPHLSDFASYRWLLIPAGIMAAIGTYILSTRWISNPIASFFAGLFYAFGPFTLGFALYHPAASALPAILPFTLLPAICWHGQKRSVVMRLAPLVTAVLATMPFIAIILFFAAAAHYSFHPIPLNEKLQLAPYAGLLTTLILKPLHFPYPGFYHVTALPLIFGLFLFFRIHRLGVILFCVFGIALSFYTDIGPISPIVWASLPILCFSIVAGLGLQGLVVASGTDKAALASCAVCMAVIAAISAIIGLNSKEAAMFFLAAGWYVASAITVYLILRLAVKNIRAHTLRWTILSLLLATDIFLSACTVVDKLF